MLLHAIEKASRILQNLNSKFYITSATSVKTLNKSKIEESTEEVFIHSNPEADEICKLILCEKDINKLMDEEFLDKNSLARKLSKAEALLTDISVNGVQERFLDLTD